MNEFEPNTHLLVPLLPESLKVMATQARPARILLVDVDEPLPNLEADEHFEEAWVFFCKYGSPKGFLILDLTEDIESIQDRLRAHFELTQDQVRGEAQVRTEWGGELPRITVVIPTIVARVRELELCLDSIAELDYTDFEVLLIDNRSTLPFPDPLPNIVSGREGLRVIRQPQPGASAARNAGISQASGEIVAFTDDDVRVDQQWLRAIGTRFAQHSKIDAVAGLILPAELETPAQVWFERYYGGFSGERTFSPVTIEVDSKVSRFFKGTRVVVLDAKGIETKTISIMGIGAYGASANLAFRRSALEKIGGFDTVLGIGTRARGGEDLMAIVEVLWNDGQLGYEPAAFVFHRHRREYADLLAQVRGYGLGFSAFTTSLVCRHPKRLWSVVTQVPVVAKWKAFQFLQRIRQQRVLSDDSEKRLDSYPFALFVTESLAMLLGPGAYFRSRRAARKFK